MFKVAATIMASILTFSSSAALAEATKLVSTTTLMPITNVFDKPQERDNMFDGVNLTEHQRQQMRDLMHQARKDLLPINIEQVAAMHELVIAEKFDRAAVTSLAEKMAEEQVNRQVEIARIRNQMYQLLTPEQKNVLSRKYEQNFQSMRKISGLHPTFSDVPESSK